MAKVFGAKKLNYNLVRLIFYDLLFSYDFMQR